MAEKIVRHHAGLAAVAGFVPMPIVGSIAVTGIQLDMLGDISRLYGVPFSPHSGRTLLVASAGGVLNYYISANPITRAVRDFLNATVPWLALPLRTFAGPAFVAGYTVLLGNAFVLHYESGGTYVDFKAADFRAELNRKLGMFNTKSDRVIDVATTSMAGTSSRSPM